MSNDTDIFFNNNIRTINKLVEKILLLTIIVPILFIILSSVGIWQVPNSYSYLLICFSFLSYAISFVLNMNPKFAKLSMYWGIVACAVFVELLAVKNIISVNITYAIVPFLSTLYYNRKLTLISCILSFLLMFTSFLVRMDGMIENVYVRNANTMTDFQWFISAATGYTSEFIFVFIVAIAIAKLTHKSMEKVIETSNQLDEANEKLITQNTTLHETQGRIIQFIADILGSHDLFTGRHVMHTQAYVKIIATTLRKEGYYTETLTDKTINEYKTAAFLHDIGKIHIPEGVLNKPGKFTEQEFELMMCHPAEGLKLLEVLPEIEGGRFNTIAKDMAYCHHEKWDGSGYPRGISGEEIPLSARIMAAADVLDALISKRLYKDPVSIDDAMEIFRKSSGSHFEPCIADAVINCKDQIEQIRNKFIQDEAESEAKEVEWWANYHANFKTTLHSDLI